MTAPTLQVGDYVCDSLSTSNIAPIYQIVHIEDHPTHPRVIGFAVLDYRCNPPLTRWGNRRCSGTTKGWHRVPEMLVLARAAEGERVCGPPPGWEFSKEDSW